MLNPMREEVLSVRWQMADPPLPPQEWKIWEDVDLGAGAALERDLAWPSGTLAVLEAGFKQGLPRGLGWDVSALAHQDPFLTAAQIFRRGVGVRPEPRLRRAAGEYCIRITPQWDDKDLFPEDHLIFIDEHAAQLWKVPEHPHIVHLHLDEASKNLSSVAFIVKKAKEVRPDAPWTIIGGGILADTAAFAAALMGQAFRLVPTTLLAMIDACIGGKTGVNFPPFGKNQVGLFAFPSEVFISTAWLQTLAQREFLAGLNEGYKHALLIGDPKLGLELTKMGQRPEEVLPYLGKLIALKAKIVEQDPNERGIRMALNLGHTLGHALERVSQSNRGDFPLLHGEAIGVGLLFCIELSLALGYLPLAPYQSMRQQLLGARSLIKPRQLLKHLGFADLTHDALIEELLIGIKQDKKARSQDGSDWVLLKDWGKVVEESGRYTVGIFDDDFRTIYRRFVQQWLNS